MTRYGCALALSSAAMVVTLAGIGRPAEAGVPAYSLVGSYELPGAGAQFDVMADGRLLAISGQQFFTQDGMHGSSWTLAGSLGASAPIASFGASFLSLSPDGQTIAVGDNNFGPSASVYLVDSSSLSPIAESPALGVAAPNYQAHWLDDSTLFVSGSGSESVVSEITLTGATAQLRTAVNDFGGGSSGVTSDGQYLYVGNGFSFGAGSPTGEVRAIPLSMIVGGSAPASFLSDGVPVARALSADSLGFDSLGNMLIGGGDFFGGGEFGFAAIVDAGAVAAAHAGGPVATASLALTPRLGTDSYSVRLNPVTGELLVTYFDNTNFEPGATVYRYAVPGPGAVLPLVFAGILSARRRRGA